MLDGVSSELLGMMVNLLVATCFFFLYLYHFSFLMLRELLQWCGK